MTIKTIYSIEKILGIIEKQEEKKTIHNAISKGNSRTI